MVAVELVRNNLVMILPPPLVGGNEVDGHTVDIRPSIRQDTSMTTWRDTLEGRLYHISIRQTQLIIQVISVKGYTK